MLDLTRLMLVALLITPCALAQEDAVRAASWPQFRGHQANGVARGAATPTRWNVERKQHLLWKTKIPGLAHAAPIVWGDRVYIATAVGPGEAQLKVGLYGDIGAADDNGRHQWRLLALDRTTGKRLFDKAVHTGIPRSKRHTKASHCNSTPATDGRRIVAIFGSEGLFCFDMDGALQWKKDLGPMDAGYFRAPSAQWGFGSSPVIHDGKVVVLCDVQKGAFLAQYDLADGKQLWRTARADVSTWGTPTVVEVGEQTQILVNGWRHTGAYAFDTGKEIWKLNGGGDIPVPTPIVAHGFAYLTSAHGRYRPIRAIRLTATGDITPPKLGVASAQIPWVHDRKGNYMQTPIVVGGELYACFDTGSLSCFDAKTGAVHYRERLGGGGHTASPVSDGRHLYVTSETGKVSVIAVGTTYTRVAVNDLGENCLATPAISDGTLFFRTQGHLVAIR